LTEAYLDPLPTTVTLAEAFEPVIITAEEHAAVIRERDEARAQLLSDRQTHRSYVNNVISDMSTINEIWAEAAERNDLCGVYDTVVERSNGRCSVLFFDERTQSWSATRTVEVTITLRVTQSGNAEGRNEPDEDDVDWNEVDSYEVHEAISNLSRGSYEYEVDDDNTEDFEAEHSE
jgi:hypothetical protein